MIGVIKMRMGRINSLSGSAFVVVFACLLVAFFKIPSDCYPADSICFEKSASVFFAMVILNIITFFVIMYS